MLVLLHPDRLPPRDSLKGLDDQQVHNIRTEFEIVNTLRKSGHDVRPLGVQHELKPIADEIQAWQPHVAFNLLEEFHGETAYDQNVASFLELLRMPYTGCNPRDLVLARGKDRSKQILAYHRIPMPKFAVFHAPQGAPAAAAGIPAAGEAAVEDASRGIAQASVVDSDEKFVERVAFIHERIRSDAIAEEYIDGRELYVGVIGNGRLHTFPIWEMAFAAMPGRPIATAKVKLDAGYQKRNGISRVRPRICRRSSKSASAAWRSGSAARCCSTATPHGPAARRRPRAYFLEANPNPDLGPHEELAEAALYDGLPYDKLLDRVIALGIRRARVMG